MQNEIVLLTGRKGCGKTWRANKLAQDRYLAGKRLVVVAPMGGINLPGARKVTACAELDVFTTLQGRSVVVRPQSDEDAAAAFAFAWFVQDEAQADLVLVVDEIDLYLGWRAPDPHLLKVIRYGRHRRIDLIACTQRPANVHKDLLAQADRLLVFNMVEPNDIAYIRKFRDLDAELLPALALGEFVEVK